MIMREMPIHACNVVMLVEKAVYVEEKEIEITIINKKTQSIN